MSADAPQFPLAAGASQPMRTAGEAKGSPDFTPLWSGQAPTFAREMPTAALIATLVEETEAVMKRLGVTPRRPERSEGPCVRFRRSSVESWRQILRFAQDDDDFDPRGVGREDALAGNGVDRRQLVGVHVADRTLDGLVARLGGLEEQAVFLAVLDRALPGIDAVDLLDLGAGGEPGLDRAPAPCGGLPSCRPRW